MGFFVEKKAFQRDSLLTFDYIFDTCGIGEDFQYIFRWTACLHDDTGGSHI